jgi:hypothetical protein
VVLGDEASGVLGERSTPEPVLPDVRDGVVVPSVSVGFDGCGVRYLLMLVVRHDGKPRVRRRHPAALGVGVARLSHRPDRASGSGQDTKSAPGERDEDLGLLSVAAVGSGVVAVIAQVGDEGEGGALGADT